MKPKIWRTANIRVFDRIKHLSMEGHNDTILCGKKDIMLYDDYGYVGRLQVQVNCPECKVTIDRANRVN